MTDTAGRIPDLAAHLHAPNTPVESLPVRGYRPSGGPWRPRPAAVVIPLQTGAEPAIVLTVRSRKLALHAGQVAFPGGGRRDEEPFPVGTALREAREETGIGPDDLEVLGLLDCFDTLTGYRITPVVARLHDDSRLRPCPDEVEEIFRLSWNQAMNPDHYRHHHVTHRRREFELVSMAHSRRLIWGATAAILEQLCRKVCGEAARV